MLFAGCDTADNGKVGSTYDGNLLKYAYNGRGVDSAVGFAGLIYWPPMEVWTDQFFAGAYYGDTVTQASNRAKAAVLSYYGSYQGTDTVVIYGGGTYLSPPNYGQ